MTASIRRRGLCALLLLPCLCSAASAPDSPIGDSHGQVLTELFRHRQNAARAAERFEIEPARAELRVDRGPIAVIDASSGVVAQPNALDLAGVTLRFEPVAGGYTQSAEPLVFDETADAQGVPLGLDDDGAAQVLLPFDFPYFGTAFRELFINSDGTLTFREADTATTDRSFPRALVGPPRIAPLFADLDPSRSNAQVTVYVAADRVVATWRNVPKFGAIGSTARQTFQADLRADGLISLHYRSADLSTAIVGIFPGELAEDPEPADLSLGRPNPAPGGVAEIFSSSADLDVVAAARSFYRTHPDAYDFLAIFNDVGVSPSGSAFAFEVNVRNDVAGIGDVLAGEALFDVGEEFGSPRRLVSVMNMAALLDYPDDPHAVFLGENTPLSILAHEAGHRWLAYVDFVHPASGEASENLLGRQRAHWNFFFNSDASFLEGNRITDLGEAADPRFRTMAAVEQYSALDQYLMGLRRPEEVPGSFLVEDPTGILNTSPSQSPRTGATFNGRRIGAPLDAIIAAEGPRRPDSTLAPKEFNFAFVLVVGEEADAVSEESLAKIESFARAFPDYFREATGGRATANVDLVKLLRLSLRPYAGVLEGEEAQASLAIAEPQPTDLEVALTADSGAIETPPMVTIPAGETAALFSIRGRSPGVAKLEARALEAGFDAPAARVQVLPDPATLRFEVLEVRDGEPDLREVVVRVIDENRVPYPSVRVNLTGATRFFNLQESALTDLEGRVTVSLPPAAVVTLRLETAPEVELELESPGGGERPQFSAAGVVEAAGFEAGPVAPGGLISIFGAGLAEAQVAAQEFPLPRTLAGTQVFFNGIPAPLLYVSSGQINLQVPAEVSGSDGELQIETPAGRSEAQTIALGPAMPGVFVNAGGRPALRFSADGTTLADRPAHAGEFIEILATGLGPTAPPLASGEPAPLFGLSTTILPVAVLIDGRRLEPDFAGLAPRFAGVYQINVELPADLAAGQHELALEVNARVSNRAQFEVQ